MNKLLIISKFLLSLLFVTSMAVSCAKKPIASDVQKNDSIAATSNNVHYTNTLEKSKAINDVFAFTLPKIITGATKVQDCDSLCNQKIKAALANQSTSKTSGDNSYKFYYDKYKNQFVLNVELGETIKQQKDSIAILNKSLSTNKLNIKTIPVQFIPKWIEYLAAFGALSIIFLAIKTILFIQSKIPV